LFGQIDRETAQKATEWIGSALKSTGGWLGRQASRVTGFFGVIAGLALIPIYLFYLLLEKRSISENWTVYLPVTDSKFKEEMVFVLRSINDYLIAFFRGQVLVAICDGILYGIGFALIGLPYAFVIGAVAMVLTIIPFLGAIVTCGAALLIALVTFGDWQHPLLVLAVFAVVQGIEGYVLQPKILGDRVGLHPMVIIVAIMTGTTLLGGILGGILAIPLAAALRVIMFRYVWKKREE
jgi:predicted PurR-regulated permease PerM